MAKDQTEVGITGQPIPKPRTPKQQYELEKKRRMQKHLGTNVGGQQYTSGAKYYVPSVTLYTNPQSPRTFREFVEIAEVHRLAHQFPLSPDELKSARRIGKNADFGSTQPTQPTQPNQPGKSARRITKQNYEVREESETKQKPLPPKTY